MIINKCTDIIKGGKSLKYYSLIIVISWLTLIILSILIHESERLSKGEKRFSYTVNLVVAFSALFEWLGVYMSGNTDFSPWMIQLVKSADYILTPFAATALFIQLRNKKVLERIVISILAFNTIFQIVTAFTGGMITIDSNNNYLHGSLYPIYMVIYLVLIVLTIIGFVSYGQNFRRQNRFSLYSIMIFILAGILVQELTESYVRTAYLVISIGLVLLYIHNSAFYQIRLDDELKEKDYQIMMSQIKPHFLFNSLTVIREIYQDDLEAGNNAILNFSRFLRYSLDALGNDRMIDFSEELENTKRYLELQQLRFGDKLQVSYDIECKDFKLPTLSFQPLVENAVSYGARQQEEGNGRVTIRTREYDDRYELSVIDNGPGFVPEDVSKQTDRAHIGISNIKERLDLTGCGELKIDSMLGTGTTATLIFPKGEQK